MLTKPKLGLQEVKTESIHFGLGCIWTSHELISPVRINLFSQLRSFVELRYYWLIIFTLNLLQTVQNLSLSICFALEIRLQLLILTV